MHLVRTWRLALAVFCFALGAVPQRSWSVEHGRDTTVVQTRTGSPAQSAQRNTFRLLRNGDRIELTNEQGSVLHTRELLAPADRFVIHGTGDDDTLIVDYSGGNPIPAGGLLFDGGDQRTPQGDELALAGTAMQRVSHTAFNGHDGVLDVDGAQIEYRALEPVNLGGPVADLTLDLSGLADFGILEATGNQSESQLRAATFTAETQIFKHPTNSLTIRLGSNADVLQINDAAFAASLTVNGQDDTDIVILNAPINIGGTLSITAESITINPLSATVTATAGQTYNGPVKLATNATLSSDGAIQLPEEVSGGFSLAKAGSGTMTLPVANSYSGGTVVSAGTLRVNNVSGSGTGTGPVSVSSGAILGGTGSISGVVTLQSGGVVAPGASIGTLAAGANVTWNGSSSGAATAQFELSNVDSTSDRLSIVGAFLKGSGPTFGFDFQGTGQTTVYTLATFASTTFAASDFSHSNLTAGLDGVFSISGGTSLLFTTGSAAATSFTISVPGAAFVGVPFVVTVTAFNQFGHVATGYNGTVNLSSSDPQASLPPTLVLVNGVGTFVARLGSEGSATISAVDSTNSSIAGTSAAIAVALDAAAAPLLSPLGVGALLAVLGLLAARRMRA